jgi:endonuclease/exonuclease/phosphatase family metal-dependent hydrolase
MRRLWFLALLLLGAASAEAADRRLDKTRLVLMTLNAEFLWDGIAPEDGDADFARKGSRERAEAHMREIAGLIRAADADLVNLAEVENLQALERLNSFFLKDLGYRAYLVDGNDTATGQDMGLLTRIDLDKIGRDPRPGWSGNVKKAVSKHYQATLKVGSLKIGLVGLHLMAKPDDLSRIAEREAQADAIRRMTRELKSQGFAVVVWGDFNDYDGATPDLRDNKPKSRVLAWIRGLDPKTSADDLENAARFVDQKKRATAHVDKNGNGRVDGAFELSAIDHILLDPALVSRVAKVEMPQAHNPTRVTDHYPIVVTLRLE